MAFIWFVIWLIANNVGGQEALTMDPVNTWAATLILAFALDLGRHMQAAEEPGPETRAAARAPDALGLDAGLPWAGASLPHVNAPRSRPSWVRRSDG